VDDPIAVTEATSTASPVQLQDYFEEMVHRGLEGVVAKRPDAPYQAGARGYDWVKLKRAYQSRLRDTRGSRPRGIPPRPGQARRAGDRLPARRGVRPSHDRFRTVAKIGSGLSERAWKELRAKLDRDATRARPRQVDSLITPDVWLSRG
jgi:DNA ligase-1